MAYLTRLIQIQDAYSTQSPVITPEIRLCAAIIYRAYLDLYFYKHGLFNNNKWANKKKTDLSYIEGIPHKFSSGNINVVNNAKNAYSWLFPDEPRSPNDDYLDTPFSLNWCCEYVFGRYDGQEAAASIRREFFSLMGGGCTLSMDTYGPTLLPLIGDPALTPV